jgi:hypothetical protein
MTKKSKQSSEAAVREEPSRSRIRRGRGRASVSREPFGLRPWLGQRVAATTPAGSGHRPSLHSTCRCVPVESGPRHHRNTAPLRGFYPFFTDS